MYKNELEELLASPAWLAYVKTCEGRLIEIDEEVEYFIQSPALDEPSPPESL